MSPTADRLPALAAQLGETPAVLAATLRNELEQALREIDDGIAARDAEAIAHAAHAARNSVLMLDEQPMLRALRAVSEAAAAADARAVSTARGELEDRWQELGETLAAAQAPGSG